MRLHRFYVEQPLGEDVVITDGSILKQWTNVFRYQKGDFVILFDGTGLDSTYSIEAISSIVCNLERKSVTPAYIPEKRITLYLSVIKKDLFELAVQKATELGVSTIVPILSKRVLIKNLDEARLRKIAIESSEQCGRGDIPMILSPLTLVDAFSAGPSHEENYYLHMDGALFDEKRFKEMKNIGLFVGPEGGWDKEDEEIFADNTVLPLSLGKSMLRAETAAIVGCALVSL